VRLSELSVFNTVLTQLIKRKRNIQRFTSIFREGFLQGFGIFPNTIPTVLPVVLPDEVFHDMLGRPFPYLPSGKPVNELV
jgi:hypothetical protein